MPSSERLEAFAASCVALLGHASDVVDDASRARRARVADLARAASAPIRVRVIDDARFETFTNAIADACQRAGAIASSSETADADVVAAAFAWRPNVARELATFRLRHPHATFVVHGCRERSLAAFAKALVDVTGVDGADAFVCRGSFTSDVERGPRKWLRESDEESSAFAIEDEDEEEDDASEGEWRAFASADVEKCVMACARRCEELATASAEARAETLERECEPLRRELYATIRNTSVKVRDEARVGGGVGARDGVRRAGGTLRGEDRAETVRATAAKGVEIGESVANAVTGKAVEFLNWMTSDETEDERRRRVDEERVWRERRKALWEAERAARAMRTPELASSPRPVAKHTAAFVNTATAFVDMLDDSLGGDDGAIGNKLAAAEARSRALEAALRALDPKHPLLR